MSDPDLESAIDHAWVLLCGFLVSFMQCGFAMIEAGSVRSKNVQNILIKNLMDMCITTIFWWAIGYAFAFGSDHNDFIGKTKFFAADYEGTNDFRDWVFQWAFASTAATIVSGSVAERCQFAAYGFYVILMSGWVYPVFVHWTWGGGWLAQMGFLDFAGSCIVHTVGGVAGLLGALFLGPRIGRFDPKFTTEYQAHSSPLIMLGLFVLFFGWFGFNSGSTLSIVGASRFLAAKVALNTALAAATGGMGVFLLRMLINKYAEDGRHMYSLSGIVNGVLAGAVSVTAPCGYVEPWAAFVIGIVGSFVYEISSRAIVKLKIDDPVDAFPVHAGCGIWGTIAVGFFHNKDGVFYGGSGKLLGLQVLGVVVVIAWVGGQFATLFYILKRLNLLRVSKEEEEAGLDFFKHGGVGYTYHQQVIQDDSNYDKPQLVLERPDPVGTNNGVELRPVASVQPLANPEIPNGDVRAL